MDSSTRDLLRAVGIIILLSCLMDTLADTIDCSRPPPMIDPQSCCSDGGRDEVTERCAVKFNITGTSPQQPPSVDAATCLAECVLKESNYLVGQNLNIAAIRMNLQRKFPQDPEFVAAMTQSFQKCVPIAQKKLDELRKSPQGAAMLQMKCSPLSGITLGCTYTEYFQNCPAGHWDPTPQCQAARQFLKKCAIF